GTPITTPKENVELTMRKSAHVVVTVDFTGKVRPNGYMVQMTPEGGDKVGTYGGSGNVNDKNQVTFPNVPPGQYYIHRLPTPRPSHTSNNAGPSDSNRKQASDPRPVRPQRNASNPPTQGISGSLAATERAKGLVPLALDPSRRLISSVHAFVAKGTSPLARHSA